MFASIYFIVLSSEKENEIRKLLLDLKNDENEMLMYYNSSKIDSKLYEVFNNVHDDLDLMSIILSDDLQSKRTELASINIHLV